jgi:dienelactone hydrolase
MKGLDATGKQHCHEQTMIGSYGHWATSIVGDEPPNHSFRNNKWTDIETWRVKARAKLEECLARPQIDLIPQVMVDAQYTYNDLYIEELSWKFSYGPPTRAIFLKPASAKGKLPGIVGLHDHADNKYFGKEKITRIGELQHPVIVEHQDHYYSGRAWANELAKLGYAVLVHDAYAFGSRRVLVEDVHSVLGSSSDSGSDEIAGVQEYNRWAAEHESIMAKSLFCAGTTWPGVFATEDRVALDILSSRPDVDSERLGCAGLSGGGLRTVFLAGCDDRIRCAVCVGMMTTWRDYLLYKSYTHTWMVYVPLLPRELDYPEILGLRAPLPTMVLNNWQDPLFTPTEMERADQMLKKIYEKTGNAERYRCSFYPGPHKFDQGMQLEAFSWFDRWLK